MTLLRLDGISKRFGSNQALDAVTLELHRGEILCILGENGAGKSTLMKIAAGAMKPDAGSITFDNQRVDMTPQLAAELGVAMTFQHFVLVPALSAAENLLLTEPALPRLLSPRSVQRIAAAMVERSGIALDRLDRLVSELSVGEKAKLEMVRVLAREPRLLILDEPTSVLAPPEVKELQQVVRAVAAKGTAVAFITHKLAEVVELADRMVVMRRGSVVSESPRAAISIDSLAASFVEGSTGGPRKLTRSVAAQSETVLKLEQVSTAPRGATATLHDVTLSIAAGEIVAIAGVAGNGQSELAELVRGIRSASKGTISFRGRNADASFLLRCRELGEVPADRSEHGLIQELSIEENLALARSDASFRSRAARADELLDRYSIRAASSRVVASSLSGGNQQKVILARELERSPALLIAAEPTRGLDLAATRFVHEQLRVAAERGTAVLLITSDLDEATLLCDALHVMYRGHLGARLDPRTPLQQVGRLMAGIG